MKKASKKKPIKKFPNGGDIKGPIGYLNSYYDSDEFKKRSGENYTTNLEYTKKQRNKYRPIMGSDASHEERYNTGPIYYSQKQADEIGADLKNDVVPHEYSHLTRNLDISEALNVARLNKNPEALNKLQSLIDKRKELNSKYGPYKFDNFYNGYIDSFGIDPHTISPVENYADLNALRWMMYSRGIYDTRKGKLDSETFKKVMNDPAIKDSSILKRMLQNFTPENIVELNNEVAYNDNNTNNEMAKSGIHIKPSKRGSLHKALGIPEGNKIPVSKLKIKSTDSEAVKKRKRFALNAKKWHKGEDGLELDPIDFSNHPTWLDNYNDIPQMPGFNDANNLAPVQVSNTPMRKTNVPFDIGRNLSYPTPNLFGKELPKTLPAGPQPKNNKKFDWGWLNSDNLLTGLSAIDALIPSKKAKTNYLSPADQIWDNPNPYGTGSTALMENGGHLSAEKAKEILRDGTANGKKLTKKQKEYFGYIAGGGKAPDGTSLPTKTVKYREELYSPFGNYGRQAFEDGWMPESDPVNGVITYKNRYNRAFNSVYIPGQDKQGNVSLVGNQNGTFDVVLRDGNNQVKQTLLKAGDINSVNDYFTNYNSTIANRVNNIKNGLNPDNDPNDLKLSHQMVSMKSGGKMPTGGFLNSSFGDSANMNGIFNNIGKHIKMKKNTFNINTNYPSTYDEFADLKNTPNEQLWNLNIFQNGDYFFQDGNIFKNVDNQTMKSGGDMVIEDNQFEQISPSFLEFQGPSHAKGGIDINYAGNNVEVEGNEMFSVSPDGTGVVWGNMTVPGTKMKFKTAGKKLAKSEGNVIKQGSKGSELLENNDPKNRFERLSYNAGILKTLGASEKMNNIHEQKEFLANLQNNMLELANEHGIDPEAMSNGKIKKAKKGMSMKKCPDGASLKPTIEKIANKYDIPPQILYDVINQESGFNPSAISNKGAKGIMQFMVPTAKSLGLSEAQLTSNKPEDIEANIEAGAKYLSQLRKQNNGDIALALAAYNGGQAAVDFVKKSTGKKDITGQDLIDFYTDRQETNPTNKKNAWQNQTLSYVNNILDKGYGRPEEERRMNKFRNEYYSPNTDMPLIGEPPAWMKTFDPRETPPEFIPPRTSANSQTPPDYGFNFSTPPEEDIPSNVTKLRFEQYAPELYAIATNRPSFVPAQKYTPRLYEPYQVSFQDRINENNSLFNAIENTLSDNPEALSVLSGQLYNANNAVRGEEFRTNQGINNDIINKNISLENDAQLKNLGILDTQYVRQEQARSNTRRDTQTILNSLSSKILQHDYENATLAAYENLSSYRMVDTDGDGIPDKTTYFGPQYTPPTTGVGGTTYNEANSTQDIQYKNYPESKIKYDKYGVPVSSTYEDRFRLITRGNKKKKAGGNLQKKFNEQFGRK